MVNYEEQIFILIFTESQTTIHTLRTDNILLVVNNP